MIVKRLTILFLVWLFSIATAVQAQNITNYAFAASTGTFTALATPTYPTLSAGNADDGYFNNIPISFDFWYMGTLYTTVSASTNGWLTLGANITNSTVTNNLSGGGAPRPVIAPLWDDLDIQVATNVSYKITGSAPNRVFTIQYLNTQWRYNATGNTMSFQVKLYEGTGKVEFVYKRETGTLAAPSASIGITATATGSGNFLSVNNAGTSVSSTVEASVTSKPVTGRTFAFTPLVPTAPGSLTFSGVTTSSMTLNWSDLSSNETGFFIYRSTDAVNYIFVSQTFAGATSSVQSGLTSATTYYWKVYAVAEGGMSAALSGSQATTTEVIGWYNSDWLYRKAITIDYAKVAAGPHTNFPMLISRADVDLQTKAQTDADDILFTSSDGTTKLSHELESYTGASGTLAAWVKIPSLSSAANTVIYMYYGNSMATNQQNITGTWETNFKGVWHMNTVFTDATSNANNGTNAGTTAGTGKISGGRVFSKAVPNYISITGLMGSPANATLSAWGTLTSRDVTGAHIINIGDYLAINVDDVTDGYLGSYYDAGWGLTKSSPKINPAGSGWHYFVYTFNDASNTQVLYMDGIQVGSGAFANSIVYSSQGTNTFIGKHANGNVNYDFDGTIDEVRVSNAIRSAGWILTEYNNQNLPSTFYGVGVEVNSGAKIFTGTGNFSTAARWSGGTLPVAGENIVIDGTCTVDNNAGTDNVAFGSLIIGTATGRALNWAAGGTNRLNVTNVSAGAGASTLDMTNGGTLILRGTWTATNLTFTPGAGTIEAQSTITLPAAYATYNNLTVNGSGITVGLAAATAVTGNVILTAGTLNANNADLTVGSNWTNNASTTAFTAGTASVVFNSTTAQAIGGTFATAFNNLTIANTAGTVSLNVNASLSGNISITSGTFDLAGFSANRASAGGTVTIANNATLRIGGAGSFPANFTTNTLEVTSTVEYSGTTQTVKALTYGNLTISGAGSNSKTANGHTTVNGVLNLSSANASATQGCLEMSTFTLTMGADATTTGTGDVTGIVKRTAFIANTPYSFGNQFTTMILATGGTMPTDISFKIGIGSSPSWKTSAVQRTYDIIRTGGSNTKVTFSLHYLDNELQSNIESDLIVWDYHSAEIPPIIEEHGKANQNTADNWVAISNRNITYFGTAFDIQPWGLSNKESANFVWQGTPSSDWNDENNWSGGVIPDLTSDVLIPDASTTLHDPVLPSSPAASVKTLTIQGGGILDGGSATVLTIVGSTGSWLNMGIFNMGTSTVIFTHANATISGTTDFYNLTIASGAGLSPETGIILRIAGILTNNGTFRAALLPNTIEFNGADQVVINPNGLTPGYYNLILSGSGMKTMPGSALSILRDFFVSGSASATSGAALSVGGNVTMESGTALNLGSFSHTFAENLTNNGGTLTSLNSSVTFNGIGLQTITTSGFAVNNLTITNTSANVILGTSTNCSIGGNLTVFAGAVFDLAANSLAAVTGSVENSGTIRTQNISATPVPAGKTWGGYFEYAGTGTQTIVAGTYNNLTMSGSGGATADANITVNGILHLAAANPSATKGILDMGSNTVLMGPASTTVGQGDVTGIVRRTTILANVAYSFGHQYSVIEFPDIGTMPSDISVKISIGTAPVWKPDAIQRIYDIIHTGGSGTHAYVYCHYLDSELNGNSNNGLVDWLYISALPLVMEYGRSDFNTSHKWISIADVDIAFFASSFGEMEVTLAESQILALTWNGSVDVSWSTAENWTPNGAPSDFTAITIPDAATTNFDLTIPIVATCGTMTIESGGIVNTVDGAQLTIAGADGAWSNTGGTFNAGTSTVIFNNSGATMAGSSDFNNLTIDTTAVLVLQNNTYLGITGTLTNNGPLGTVENGATTVEYKGAGQTVVVPSANSYRTLILSGSGIKTMPITDLNIEGNFSMSGTATATAGAAMTIAEDVTIGAGSNFITGSYNHSIGGNLDNSGSFTISTGNTITLNGTSSQSVQAIDTINFDNLTINNTHIVNLFDNINVNNALTLTSGNLSVGGTTLGINGTISKTSGYIEVVPQSSLIFGGSGAITLNSNLFTTTPSINNITINRTGGVTLGNQNMTVNGLLDLSSGTISLGANTLTIAGSSPVRTSGTIDAGNAGATLAFTNTTAITLPVSIFTGDINNLTINGTGGVTASSDFTVTGVLNLQSENPSSTKGSLDLWDGSAIKSLSMGENATTIGVGDATGIVVRTSAFIANKPYTFGNQFYIITFSPGGTYPTQLQAKTTIGTSPSWKPEAIKRIDDFIQTGGSGCFVSVISHYLDAELNGNNEETLVRWKHTPPSTIVELGRTDHDTTDNWVMNANIGIANFPSSFGSERTSANSELAVLLWNGSVSTAWVTMENWTPRSSPSNLSNISIPDTSTTLYSPTLPASTEIKTLTIEAAGILNAVANEQLTINGATGAWNNEGGTFNPGTGNVIFTNIAATISGTTNFYDVTINTGKGLWMTSGSTMRIAGTMTNNGTWHTDVGGPTTVEYNGTSAQMIDFTNAITFYNVGIDNAAGVTLSSIALTTVSNQFVINTDKLFEVAPGKQLTIAGTLINNAGASGFVLQSDATGTASLIHNTNDEPATVQRYISGTAEAWHFLSSPVSDQSISGSWLPSGTYGNGTGYDMYGWNEPNSCWIYQLDITSPVNWSTIHPGADFAVGRGYLYSVQAANPTKEFVGKLNNGPLDYELTFSGTDASLKGFNLVGNPYPSSIDWRAASGWTRTVLNITGGGNDMWIWNPAANNYGVYNSADADGTGTNSVTRYIAPMQGYFVQAAAAGNLSMDNDVRVHDGAGTWFKSTEQEVSQVSLIVKSDAGYGFDEIQLEFGYAENENGAMKLFSKTAEAPSLYMASEGDYLSVLYLTGSEENPSVPVLFTPGMNGNYTINCNFNPDLFETVMLEDRQTQSIRNMKSEKTYNFTASKKDDANRFVLYFGPVKNHSENEFPANIYTDGSRLIVDLTLISKETDLFVYDIMGRSVLQQKLEGEIRHYLNFNAPAQILIVYLKNPDGSLCRKLLWGRNSILL